LRQQCLTTVLSGGVQAHFRNQGGTAVLCLPSLNFCSGRFFLFPAAELKNGLHGSSEHNAADFAYNINV